MTAADDLRAELTKRGVDLKAVSVAEVRAKYPELEHLWIGAAFEKRYADHLGEHGNRATRRKIKKGRR